LLQDDSSGGVVTRVPAEQTRASVSWSKAFPVTFIKLSPKLMFTGSVKAEEDGSQLS
jgi:hypothetical protein